MNNRGFTLVELLAVVTILLSISLVAVVNVTASLEKTKEQEIQRQQKIVINAAKLYFASSDDLNLMKYGSSVMIDLLVKNKYVKLEEVGNLNVRDCVFMCSNGLKVSSCGSSC